MGLVLRILGNCLEPKPSSGKLVPLLYVYFNGGSLKNGGIILLPWTSGFFLFCQVVWPPGMNAFIQSDLNTFICGFSPGSEYKKRDVTLHSGYGFSLCFKLIHDLSCVLKGKSKIILSQLLSRQTVFGFWK